MSSPTTAFKYRDTHVGDLADGRPAVPGETYKLNRDQVEHPHNARLIAEGKLLELPARGTAKTKESD
jgi:hypothetical protein